jgi:hypothetical protein
MDTAVALVQAYLHINGYFTVTEYPVLEAIKHGGYRTATDIDVLGVRFPHAGRLVPRTRSRDGSAPVVFETDPGLGALDDVVDMIVGEVKHGRAELNHGARDPDVLRVVLMRFGSCPPSHVDRMVEGLLRNGSVLTPSGHRVRLFAFGGINEGPIGHGIQIMTLGHIVKFIRAYLREHWEVLRHAQFSDPGFDMLMLLEKLNIDTHRPSRKDHRR